MTAQDKISAPASPAAPKNQQLTRVGTEHLWDFVEKRDRLTDALDGLARLGDEVTAKAARRLSAQLDALEPSVTMIGQVKAGKTTLVNALIGMPDLLPADVNPWTSVVTALHLSPNGFEGETRASFRFFGEDDWERLFRRGGRIGELASRAGAEDEVAKVHAQLTELREKSRRRLGRRFEMLLSQQHDYAQFDRALIERYVVLGDDFENDSDTHSQTGRFADITRSADLWLDRPDLPLGLCIRDTPGVNDTFMIREQITIRAIRDSRLCVVVLSAHQAMSNVDLALVRLIANVRSREVIIFVNRIDELPDPGTQVPEIEASIRATLKAHDGPADCALLFGSAFWAGRALSGRLKGMPRASADALVRWAGASGKPEMSDAAPELVIWELSGVPDLMRAIGERIAGGEGAEALERGRAEAANLHFAIDAALQGAGAARALRPPELLAQSLDQTGNAARVELAHRFETLEADFRRRLERAHDAFLDRATTALIAHLQHDGEERVWHYDPAALRMMLRTACQVYSVQVQRQVDGLYKKTAAEVTALWRAGFDGLAEGFALEPPAAPRVPPPVQIGQTIALDLKGSWWRRWWQKRRGFESYAADFRAMISAETAPVITDLAAELGAGTAGRATGVLAAFIAGQRELLLNAATPDRPVGADGARQKKALAAIGAMLEGLEAAE